MCNQVLFCANALTPFIVVMAERRSASDASSTRNVVVCTRSTALRPKICIDPDLCEEGLSRSRGQGRQVSLMLQITITLSSPIKSRTSFSVKAFGMFPIKTTNTGSSSSSAQSRTIYRDFCRGDLLYKFGKQISTVKRAKLFYTRTFLV